MKAKRMFSLEMSAYSLALNEGIGAGRFWKEFLTGKGVRIHLVQGSGWFWEAQENSRKISSGPYLYHPDTVSNAVLSLVQMVFESNAVDFQPSLADTTQVVERYLVELNKRLATPVEQPKFTVGEVDRQIHRLRRRQGASKWEDRKAVDILENLRGQAKVLVPEGWVKLPEGWQEDCKYTDEQVRDRIARLHAISNVPSSGLLHNAADMLEYFFTRDITRTMPAPEDGGIDDTGAWVQYDGARYHLLSDEQIARLERAKLMEEILGERVMKMLGLPSTDPTIGEVYHLLSALDRNQLLEDRNALISVLIAQLQERTPDKKTSGKARDSDRPGSLEQLISGLKEDAEGGTPVNVYYLDTVVSILEVYLKPGVFIENGVIGIYEDPNEIDLKGLTVEQATLVRGVINAFRGDK